MRFLYTRQPTLSWDCAQLLTVEAEIFREEPKNKRNNFIGMRRCGHGEENTETDSHQRAIVLTVFTFDSVQIDRYIGGWGMRHFCGAVTTINSIIYYMVDISVETDAPPKKCIIVCWKFEDNFFLFINSFFDLVNSARLVRP